MHEARTMRVLLVLAALCQCGSPQPPPHITTTKQINTGEQNLNIGNKSMEFVNIIKEDLRRNNDDYELQEGENQLEHSVPPAGPAQHVPPARPASPVSPARPASPVSPARPASPVSPARPASLVSPARPASPVSPARPAIPAYPALPGRPTPRQPYRNGMSPSAARLQPTPPPPARAAPPPAPAAPVRRFDMQRGVPERMNQQAAVRPKEFRSYTRTKQYKSLRLNKLKQLLNKDKVGIRQQDLDQPQPEYQRQAEDQPEAEGQPDTEDQTEVDDEMGTSPPATRPTSYSPPPRTTDGPPRSPLTTRRHTFQPLDDREQGPVLRNRKDNSLSPGQLDMAAARNPELTRIRIKGRLCQRSLMNAEGPTYDKLGKMLQPEHRPKSARGRQFHQTRAPSLLLPRCCNCCKKSVLGCQ